MSKEVVTVMVNISEPAIIIGGGKLSREVITEHRTEIVRLMHQLARAAGVRAKVEFLATASKDPFGDWRWGE